MPSPWSTHTYPLWFKKYLLQKTLAQPSRMTWVLSPTYRRLPATSKRIKLWATAAAPVQHPLKGVEIRNEAFCVLAKNWQKRSWDRHFQEMILGTQFLHLLISRKAQKSFTVTSAPHDWQKTFMRLAENFCKKKGGAWLYVLPLHQNHSSRSLWSSFWELN